MSNNNAALIRSEEFHSRVYGPVTSGSLSASFARMIGGVASRPTISVSPASGQRRDDHRHERAHRFACPFASHSPLLFHPEMTDAGGLAGYGTPRAELYRRSAYYVQRIFEGVKPADLAVEQPTRIELSINMKTAKCLASPFQTPCSRGRIANVLGHRASCRGRA